MKPYSLMILRNWRVRRWLRLGTINKEDFNNEKLQNSLAEYKSHNKGFLGNGDGICLSHVIKNKPSLRSERIR